MDGTEITTLKTLIDWAIRVGAAQLAFWLMNRLPVDGLAYDTKNFLSWAIAGVLALAAWGAGIGMGYISVPTGDWRAWVEGAAGIVLTVVVLNRGLYARAKAAGRV